MEAKVENKNKVIGSVIKRLIPIFDANIPKEIQSESSKLYSGGLTPDGVIARGLTTEEEIAYLPGVIGTSVNSPNWEDEVRSYWENFDERVPYVGLSLQCGFGKDGKPLNLRHYIISNLAENDNTVAITSDIKEASMSHGYILVDESEQKKILAELNDGYKDADREFVKLIDSDNAENAMRYILISNNKKLELPIYTITAFDVDNLIIQIRKYKEKDPIAFVKDAKSKYIEYKAVIYLGVEYNLLTKMPHNNQYYKQDELLGSLEQACKTLELNNSMYAELLGDIAAVQAKQ